MSGTGGPRGRERGRVGPDGFPEVFVADEQDAVPIDTAPLAALAEGVLRAEGVRGATELSLLFVDAAAIADLNREYLGGDGPTDVLAFPLDAEEASLWRGADPDTSGPDRPDPDTSEQPLLLGDVVICPEVAAENAPYHAGTLDDELALLVVHGILHVLGHDHADPEQTAVMQARERALLEELHWRGPAPAGFRQEHQR